jgi:hypothetical protein
MEPTAKAGPALVSREYRVWRGEMSVFSRLTNRRSARNRAFLREMAHSGEQALAASLGFNPCGVSIVSIFGDYPCALPSYRLSEFLALLLRFRFGFRVRYTFPRIRCYRTGPDAELTPSAGESADFRRAEAPIVGAITVPICLHLTPDPSPCQDLFSYLFS